MGAMFYDCTSLTEIDLSNFNFSNLNSGGSFNNFCYNCSSLEYLTISNFSNNNLINFGNAFYGTIVYAYVFCRNCINDKKSGTFEKAP